MNGHLLNLLFSACGALLIMTAVVDADPSPETPTIDGYWVLSRDWQGHMGIAIKLEGSNYHYWAYSDVVSDEEPQYPERGTIDTAGARIVLSGTEEHKYDNVWNLFIWKNEICLLAERDLKEYRRTGVLDRSRLLRKLPQKAMKVLQKPDGTPPMNF